MREILFRGKSLKTGEWVHGLITGHKPGASMSFISNADYPWEISVIPETVGQWTGVLDSDGAKIFEGDILEIEKGTRKYRRQVKWFGHVQLPSFELVDTDGFVPGGDFPGHLVWDEYGAYRYVIGNIYDNPELLKGGES